MFHHVLQGLQGQQAVWGLVHLSDADLQRRRRMCVFRRRRRGRPLTHSGRRRRRPILWLVLRVAFVVAGACMPPARPAAPAVVRWCIEGTADWGHGAPLVVPLCESSEELCQQRRQQAVMDGGYNKGITECHQVEESPPGGASGGGCAQGGGDGGGGCVKGCRCGNSCIDCSDTCHGGATYRRRRR